MYLGIAYDTMRIFGWKHEDFYMNIKPQAGYTGLISGPAFTTYGEVVVGCSSERYRKLDNIRLEFYKPELFKNKPIVCLQSNDSVVAHSGDITSLIYKKLGASGFVTDGNVRDIELIDELGFPTFCRDVNPIDALDYWALTRYQIPIYIDQVEIDPGDLILGSKDGVIRVPNRLISEFNRVSSEQLQRENSIRDIICAKDNTDFVSLVQELGRW